MSRMYVLTLCFTFLELTACGPSLEVNPQVETFAGPVSPAKKQLIDRFLAEQFNYFDTVITGTGTTPHVVSANLRLRSTKSQDSKEVFSLEVKWTTGATDHVTGVFERNYDPDVQAHLVFEDGDIVFSENIWNGANQTITTRCADMIFKGRFGTTKIDTLRFILCDQ